MARKCSVTGKRALSGHFVSHSHNLTKRRFQVNLIKKRIFVPEKNQWITVKLSARALKTIKARGAGSVLSQAGLI
jgi:large subunit ribosomal protein L28